MKIKDRLKDRSILIWGYGREGKSTENFIRSHCQVKSMEIFEGAESDIDPDKYDYIIKAGAICLLLLAWLLYSRVNPRVFPTPMMTWRWGGWGI